MKGIYLFILILGHCTFCAAKTVTSTILPGGVEQPFAFQVLLQDSNGERLSHAPTIVTPDPGDPLDQRHHAGKRNPPLIDSFAQELIVQFSKGHQPHNFPVSGFRDSASLALAKLTLFSDLVATPIVSRGLRLGFADINTELLAIFRGFW